MILGPSGTGADIVGLQSAGIGESTLTQANKIKGDKILELFAAFIDGQHANAPGDVRIVTSVGSECSLVDNGSGGDGRKSDHRAVPTGQRDHVEHSRGD